MDKLMDVLITIFVMGIYLISSVICYGIARNAGYGECDDRKFQDRLNEARRELRRAQDKLLP